MRNKFRLFGIYSYFCGFQKNVMASKLDKLKEIGELLSSGAITQEEFDKLKSEILNEKEAPQKDEVKPEKKEETARPNNSDKEKIILKSFHDHNHKLVKAPGIEYINFKDISNEERTVLRTFLRKKQISAPEEMTQDEIDLGNKLFTHAEIVKMNSERTGFNYPWGSILGLLAVGVATIFLYISPCFVILGAGTGLVYGAFSAGWILTRADATKMDKRVSGAALILAILVFFFMDSIHSMSDGGSSSESIDCSSQSSSYEQGYASGETAKMLGDYSGCHSYVSDYNEGIGRNVLDASDCFCQGYEDGKSGKPKRY